MYLMIYKFCTINCLFYLLDEIITQPLAKAAAEDHPLNPNPNSQWQSFFKDNEVLLQVLHVLFVSL